MNGRSVECFEVGPETLDFQEKRIIRHITRGPWGKKIISLIGERHNRLTWDNIYRHNGREI